MCFYLHFHVKKRFNCLRLGTTVYNINFKIIIVKQYILFKILPSININILNRIYIIMKLLILYNYYTLSFTIKFYETEGNGLCKLFITYQNVIKFFVVLIILVLIKFGSK